VSELLGELLGPALARSSIADLGCSTGLCGPLVRPWASQLRGCDLSSGMLDKAERRQVYDSLHHGELVEFLQANLAAFDVLLCADTFCYFGDLALAIEAAAHALKPGGHLVFTLEALLTSPEKDYHLQPHGRYAHGRTYVERLLQQSGFRLDAFRQESLRMEAGQPVPGWLIGATATPPDQ
jgi:predicted TPR repeat methyltransferase